MQIQIILIVKIIELFMELTLLPYCQKIVQIEL